MGFTSNGLTRLQYRGTQSYPVVYSGGGEAENINFDFSNANFYHRITGSVSVTQEESDTQGCEIVTTETYPMRLVAYFPSNLLGTDDSYSVLKVVANIKNKLPAELRTIAETLNIDFASILIGSVKLDTFEVWGGEFKGIDYAVPSEYNLVAIDYSIIFKGAQNCFEDYVCE